jgi:S1-C subfamily serine protease
VKLISGVPATEALNSADECPVTQLQDKLGITVVHGQVAGPWGPGIGVLEVNSGGNAAKLGLQPRDVILEANGQRVSCPRDLQEAMTRSHEAKLAPCSLIVARNGEKTSLKCPSMAQ